MASGVTWYHLDKDNKVISEHKHQACFAKIAHGAGNFEKTCQYLEYDFGQKQEVTQEEATAYFLYLKSIPEFKALMPKSCTALAKSGKYKIDLHKFNGVKVFTILTLIRAVVEDPMIVRTVISFDRKFKYSLSNLSILKMCGSYWQQNSNHWITPKMDKKNLAKEFNDKTLWDAETICINTGLQRKLFDTFAFEDDGYMTRNPIRDNHIAAIKAEINKKQTKKLKQYDTSTLQLGF